MKVLIIEDDSATAAALSASLQALGYEPVVATTGPEAWMIFQVERIRLVVSDWHLPGMDGLKLCQKLRQAGGEYVYFILITVSQNTPENQIMALAAGVDDFLPKPVVMHDLRVRLHVAERILRFTRTVRQLESMLPMCTCCKKIRDGAEEWKDSEKFFSEHFGPALPETLCPACVRIRARG